MLHYSDGQEVRLGDHVDYDDTPSVVVDIVESDRHPEWVTFNEPMVGFWTEEYGTKHGPVYEALAQPGWESIILLKRADERA